ncbi:hypothetical protein UCDDS831_g07872 [Diplodia seriata]|uniref:Uncharacterized protein n=1 Tax=Diplodia seriata TaxID=420778 RepID=A0A0G2DYD7_9PEZI|nr:hypothetical protein UCDDS831_g07872 [Diplodia seriata]
MTIKIATLIPLTIAGILFCLILICLGFIAYRMAQILYEKYTSTTTAAASSSLAPLSGGANEQQQQQPRSSSGRKRRRSSTSFLTNNPFSRRLRTRFRRQQTATDAVDIELQEFSRSDITHED